MPDTDQAQQKAQEVAGQAQEKAQNATQQARTRVREQVDQRSTTAGEQVSAQANDIRTVGQQLREQGKDQPAKLAEQAADRAEQLGGYLKDADADRILRDIEDFGRRQPVALAAAGLALGFAASRFLKASSRERYQASQRPSGDSVTPGYSYPGTEQSPSPTAGTGIAPQPPAEPALAPDEPATPVGSDGR